MAAHTNGTSTSNGIPPMPPLSELQAMSAEQLREQLDRRYLLAQFKLIESLNYDATWVDPREPLYDDATFWTPLSGALPGNLNNQGRGEFLPVHLNALGLKEVRDQSRWLCAYNEFAINAMENRANYVVGTGLKYRVVRRRDDLSTPGMDETGKQDWLATLTQDVIDEFIDSNDWGELESEIVRRCERDGEVFLRFFQTRRGIAVRVVEPEFVVESAGDPARSYGVLTRPDDVQTVIGYNIAETPGYNLVPTEVPAHEVLHLKINVDRTVKRGLPTFMPVRKNLERAEKLLRNMSVLAQIQATYAVIRKHSNVSATAVSNFASALKDIQISKPMFNRVDNVRQHLPGSIVDTNSNTEYEFPSASVNAGAYVEIMQAELRAVAARLQLPEYMLSSRAEGNYASTLVAEAPAVKGFERYQWFFKRKFGEGRFRRTQHQPVMWRVIVAAVRRGRLPREAITECEIQVETPRLTVRDRTSETNRYATLSQAGVLSLPTWAQLEDLDYEREQRQGAGKKEGGDGQGGGDDLASMLGGLGGGGDAQGGEQEGGLPSQDTTAGVPSPKPGLGGVAQPGTFTEAVIPGTLLPRQAQPHRKSRQIKRDGYGHIVEIVDTVEPIRPDASGQYLSVEKPSEAPSEEKDTHA